MNGTDVLCNSTQTGNLEISATSGVTPYTYQWIGTNNTSTYVTSVGPGTYSCVVTDGLGCTDTVVTVLAVSNIAATASASNPLCYGTNTGSVTVAATGGQAPYTYDWAGSTVSSVTLSGLGEGAYSCVVTDAYGCSTSASATVVEPAAWTVSAAVTPAIFGTDGAIDLSVSGSTSPYSFSWSNGATSEDISNLDGGNYIVTITDASGCTYNDTIVVGSLVGLDAQNLEETLVYPNPSNGDMFIVGAAVEQVILYNQLGQRIAFETITLGANAREITVSNVATGTYILELQGAEQVLRKSIQIFQ